MMTGTGEAGGGGGCMFDGAFALHRNLNEYGISHLLTIVHR